MENCETESSSSSILLALLALESHTVPIDPLGHILSTLLTFALVLHCRPLRTAVVINNEMSISTICETLHVFDPRCRRSLLLLYSLVSTDCMMSRRSVKVVMMFRSIVSYVKSMCSFVLSKRTKRFDFLIRSDSSWCAVFWFVWMLYEWRVPMVHAMYLRMCLRCSDAHCCC